jgi:hypothetical protein
VSPIFPNGIFFLSTFSGISTSKLKTVRALILLISLSASIWAQATGVLRGRVLDPSGAVIPKASVTLTGPNDAVKVAESDPMGTFLVSGLPPGDYTIRTTAAGFTLGESKLNIPGGRVTSLEIRLAVALERQEVTVAEQAEVAVDPAQNASAITLKGEDLNILGDNDTDLAADLQALAGPSAGPNGGQIFVDGFSNGQLPPKDSIREIRINTNPFSAEFDRSGMGRIEILTRPGTDKLKGYFQFNFADSALNARNPFATSKPPTEMRQFDTGVNGPVTKKSSFTFNVYHITQDSSSLINAQTVDPNFNLVNVTQNVLTPASNNYLSPRFDYAVTPNLTLQFRYYYNNYSSDNNGVGGFSLLSRGNYFHNANHGLQFTETQVIGTRLINESRFQYNHNHNINTADPNGPAINVLSSFNGGGSTVTNNYNNNQNYEYQNNSSYTIGRHFWRFGIRLRENITDSFQTSNYNGSYTFTSIDSYVATLRGIAQGLPFSQILALGGGAFQYSVTGGVPLTSIRQFDAGPFVQDDFKWKPNFTLSLGLRYEIQSNISDKRSVAPRVGIAWGIGKGQGNGRPPKTVLRLGSGVFYDRFSQGYILQELRQNGITQQNYVITAPMFFPVAPPISNLTSSLLPQAIYKVDSNIRSPELFQTAATLERQLPKNITLSATFTNSRGVHQLRSRNINAPLPASFTGPGTGIYPYGSSGQLFLYESSAFYNQKQFTLNVNARMNRRFSMFGYYNYSRTFSDSEGAGSFPVDNYNAAAEWGRSGRDTRHNATIGGNNVLPYKFELTENFSLNSAPPVNITTGTDLNGDTNFNDRPAFSTVAANPKMGVYATPWGVFNSDPVGHPQYGTVIIPRNYGTGFGFFGIFLRLTRTWTFGERAAADPNAARIQKAAQAAGVNINTGNQSSGSKPPGRYTVTRGISARNALNHVNAASPIAILSSPFLGQALQSVYGANANRRVELSVRFGF